MSKPVSYTPPDLADPIAGTVARRLVFYIPGYDPEARSRYRLLFVRELGLRTKRFGEAKREIGRASLSADGLVQSWTVKAHPQTQGAETRYEVLLWDDIVLRDAARSKFASAGLLLAGTGHALLAGKLFTFYRLNWKYGNVILYPFVLLLLLGMVAALVAMSVHAHLGTGYAHSLGLPAWLSIPAGILAGLAMIKACERLLDRAYFWQLLNDWIFNWQHGQGWRRDYERRLDAFAEHVLARLAAPDIIGGVPDEVMIVGHSSGALTAVEVAARLLARTSDLGEDVPNLSLLTLGSGLPLVALQPRATRLRAEIARLVTSRRIVWTDYAAPQDWMNFPGFNPVHDLDLKLGAADRIANPVLRSPRFRDIIEPATYARVRFRPFRMHFQFLMANDLRGDYDFFDLTLGHQRLRDRVSEPAEDGRTTAHAGRGLNPPARLAQETP